MRTTRCSLLWLAGILLTAHPAAAAEFTVSTWADSTASGDGGLSDNPAPDTDEATSATPGVAASSSSGASLTQLWYDGSAAWNGTGTAQAMVDTAGIHLLATGSAEVVDSQPSFVVSARGDGQANGEFTDTFVLQANGFAAGTFLRARAEIVVDSLLTASANDVAYTSIEEVFGSSSWIVTVKVVANGFTRLDTFFRSPDCTHRLLTFPTALCPPSDARQIVVFSVPVGGTTEVRLSGTVQSGGLVTQYYVGNASAAGTADLSNTIGWGGIVELTTNEGEPVTDFSMISASTGLDYREPQASVVPEPGALAGGALALASLAAFRRRADYSSPNVATSPRSSSCSSASESFASGCAGR